MRGYFLGLALGLAACAHAPEIAEVTGTAVIGPGGPPAASVWVYWESPQGAYGVRTDAEGRFRLLLPPGVYRAWTGGEGLAGSTRLGLHVNPGAQRVDLVVPRAFRTSWPTLPPRLEAQAWIEGGVVRYRAQVTPEGGLPPLALLVGLGYPPSTVAGASAAFYGEEMRDTGVRTLSPEGLGGETELYLVAYDANNNRAELGLPLSLPFSEGEGKPVELRAVSYTLTPPLEVLSTAKYGGLLVRLSWGGSGGPYRLYRDGTLLATLPKGSTSYADLTPGLAPGVRTCYRLEAADGVVSDCTTPLPPLQVNILSPKEGERTGSTPLLRWQGEGSRGAVFFRAALWNGLTGRGQILALAQATEVQAPPLSPGNPYTFELYQAYAVDDPDHPHAYAVAADRQGTLAGLSLVGPSVDFEVGP